MTQSTDITSSVYLMTSLLQMSEFGGTGAQAIMDGINSVFNDGGNLEILNFKYKLIGATANGASVNFSCVDGLLKNLERDDRPWLVKSTN